MKLSRPIDFYTAVTFVFSLLLLTANYRSYPLTNLTDLALIFSHWAFSSLGLYCLILVLSLNRFVFMVTFPSFIFISSVATFYTWQYDVSINSALIESIFLTNAYEVQSYLSFPLILFVVFTLTLSGVVVVWRFRLKWNKLQIIVVSVFFLFSAVTFKIVDTIKYNTLMVRAPFSFYLATTDYLKERREISQQRLLMGKDATSSNDSLITVFVIGEALRADHLQMNGYERETMPKMEGREVVSFPNVFSPYTHTAMSLMYILTRANNDNLNPMYLESSFVDVFKSCYFHTAWIGNQNPIKNYKYFVNECDTSFVNKPALSDYSNSKKFDSDLIEPFISLVNKNNPKQLAIVHLAGNHWWYNNNLPDSFAVFTPILDSKTISIKNRERMINSYDNVTLFVDYVLDSIIETISNKNALLIFLADHGQSFGENGKWLHANNAPAEQNPACFVWMSEKYKANYPNKYKSLISNRYAAINTAFLFHSIIDGNNIQSPFLDSTWSVFSLGLQRER